MHTGGAQVPRVVADFSSLSTITPASLFAAGYTYSVPLDKWNISDQACDFIYVGRNTIDFEIPGTLKIIRHWDTDPVVHAKPNSHLIYPGAEYAQFKKTPGTAHFILANEDFIFSIDSLDPDAVLVLCTQNRNSMPALRRMFIRLEEKNIRNPVILQQEYRKITASAFQLHAATDLGALLLDGFGDGVWIIGDTISPRKEINSLAFGILQATRTRISKTEYISCPSCGRTLFDLQETTAKIRNRTNHLKGIKIGIMGCIVNGPGEMADADYGYVGTGVGKITLYKGKEVVSRNIDSEKAVDALIELIRKHGDWVENVQEN